MATIPASQARGLYTEMLIDVYKERPQQFNFLRSFFTTKEESTKYLSIEVQRGTEKIAVDVMRGDDGNRNTFSLSTQKIFMPPYFREFFDATELDLYDRMFGSTQIDSSMVADFIQQIAEKLGVLQDKIDRAYELMCAQVFRTGIVTLTSGDNIDFKRQAGSKVAYHSDNNFASGSVDPSKVLQTGAEWLRTNAKAQGGVFNVILGSAAFNALKNNTKLQGQADIKSFNLHDLTIPQRNALGANFHGRISGDTYIFNIWTYDEEYTDKNGVTQKYLGTKEVIILPEQPRFTMGFAAIPQLIDLQNPTIKKGAYIIGDYPDPRRATHEYHIMSAGLPIPVQVDAIYTIQVIA